MPTIYKSTDTSAPSLDGQAGSLVTVLDAILVNGYGSKTAAGWTIAFTTTNKRSYKQGSPSAGVPPTQYYLDVDDTGPGAGTTSEARMRGYETMSAIATGTNPFPPAGTNVALRKKSASTAGAIAWICIADETTFYFFSLTGDTATTYMTFAFGEFYSYVSGDTYKNIIMARTENNSSGTGSGVNAITQITAVNTFAALSQTNYAARDYAGLNIGSGLAKNPLMPSAGTYMGSAKMPYPNAADGALLMSPIGVFTGAAAATLSLHGELRGFFYAAHANTNFTNLDTFSGSGALAGRTFIIVRDTDGASIGATNIAYMIIETTSWPRST